ncbi:unnamed protein product [Leuciscus chuanchicus]
MVGETEALKSVSVTEGESVTLNTDAEMHKDALMLWRFGDKGILLATIDVGTNETSLNEADERFRDRLKLDQTGSLTITNTRTTDSGFYELQIRDCESSQRFLLSVIAKYPGLSCCAEAGICLGVLAVVAAASGLIYYRCRNSKSERQNADKAESVTEGESFTQIQGTGTKQWSYEPEDDLNTEINGETIRTVAVCSLSVKEGDPALLQTAATIQPGDLILWTFGAESCLLVKADSKITDIINERFRDRLKLQKTTGSLKITDIRPTDSGYYKLQIINTEQTTFRIFNVTVTDSSGDRVNEPETSPLLNGDYTDGENEHSAAESSV